MKPIHNLGTPLNDIRAIKNIDIILGIIDTIKDAKLMDRITINMLSIIESKAVSKERLDTFFREKIELVAEKEAKTTGGEARVSLDHTFRGEVDEVADDGDDGGSSGATRGLATGRLNPKDIIQNMSKAVSSKLAVGKIDVTI